MLNPQSVKTWKVKSDIWKPHQNPVIITKNQVKYNVAFFHASTMNHFLYQKHFKDGTKTDHWTVKANDNEIFCFDCFIDVISDPEILPIQKRLSLRLFLSVWLL